MAKVKTELDIIGTNIAKYRKEKKLTQKQMADLLYVSDKTISKWERGNTAPDVIIISDVADVLCVEVNDLLRGTSKVNKDRKITKIFYIFLSIFIIVISCLTMHLYFNRWTVSDFKSDDKNFVVNGYVVSNRKESRFVVTEFSVNNVFDDLKDIERIEMCVYTDDLNLYEYITDDSNNIVKNFIRNTREFTFLTNKKTSIKKLTFDLSIFTYDESYDYNFDVKI